MNLRPNNLNWSTLDYILVVSFWSVQSMITPIQWSQAAWQSGHTRHVKCQVRT